LYKLLVFFCFIRYCLSHCPAEKGIETNSAIKDVVNKDNRGLSHCPAEKGIETKQLF